MFNQRKPRRFNYKSRLKDSEEKEYGDQLKSQWNELRGNTKRKSNVLFSLPALLIFLVLVFVLIYILNGYIT